MAQQDPISAGRDALVTNLCTCYSILNPWILVVFDMRVRKAALEMFGLGEWINKKAKAAPIPNRMIRRLSKTAVGLNIIEKFLQEDDLAESPAS